MSTEKQPLFARDPEASVAVGAALILGAVTAFAAALNWWPFFSQ